MHVVEEIYPGWRDLAIHQSSPGNRGASVKLRAGCPHYLGTHYVPEVEHGALRGNKASATRTWRR